MASQVIKLHTGGLQLSELWASHNEHRIFFLRLILLGLAKLGGWNLIKEAYFNFFLALLSLLVLWKLVSSTFPKTPVLTAGLTFILSWLVFSGVQADSWLVGWQLCFTLVNLTAFSAVLVLKLWPGKLPGLLVVMVLAIIASYTLASGLMLWPTLLVGLIVNRSKWGWRFIGLWVLVAATCIGLYFYNYAVIGPKIDYFWSLGHPPEYLHYILTFLGAPFGLGISEGVAPVYGLTGGGLLVGSLVGLYFQARRSAEIWQRALPWLHLILFTFLNTAITGLARSASGSTQALSTRYTVSSLLFWIGLIVLLTLVLQPLFVDNALKIRVIIGTFAVVSLIVLGICYTFSYNFGTKAMEQWSTRTQVGLAALYNYNSASSENLELLLIPNTAATVRSLAWSLEQYKEGPFSLTKGQYFSQIEDKWQKTLGSTSYRSLTYPGQLMKMEQGDAASLKIKDDGVEFIHAAGKPTFIWLEEFSQYNRQVKNSGWWDKSKDQALDIQVENAWYINVVWDLGDRYEAVLLAGSPVADGSKHFRTFIPPGVKRFRLDLYYSTGRELQEPLKVAVFSRI